MILLLMTGVLAVILWPFLVWWLARGLIPMLRTTVGDEVADPIAALITWIDRPASFVREQVMSAWRFFNERILAITSTYTKTAEGRFTQRQQTVLRSRGDHAEVKVITRVLDWQDLPAPVRDEMIRRGVPSVQTDDREVIRDRVEHTAKQSAMKL
jgi:hypothetical protein